MNLFHFLSSFLKSYWTKGCTKNYHLHINFKIPYMIKFYYFLSPGDTGSGISREDFIGKIADEVLNKLPEEFDMDKIRRKYGIEVSPTTIVLLQELERFNKLINRMSKSLATLKKVISSSRVDSL